MSEDGAARRKRLKDLKEKASKSIKFRNYHPQDAAARRQASDSDTTGGTKGGGGAGASGRSKPTSNTPEEGMAYLVSMSVACDAAVHISAATRAVFCASPFG